MPLDLDTSSSSPQYSFTALKSPAFQKLDIIAPPVLAAMFLLMGLLVASNSRDAHHAPIFFTLAFCSLLLYFPLRRFSRTRHRIGIDRSQNTIWILYGGKGDPVFIPDADRIDEFGYFKEVRRRVNFAWTFQNGLPMFWTTTKWLITCRYKGKEHHEIQFNAGFASPEEAETAIHAAQMLITSVTPQKPPSAPCFQTAEGGINTAYRTRFEVNV